MSLILQEFDKANLEVAIKGFTTEIYKYDVIANYDEVVNTYKTPQNYVSSDTRGLSYDEVSFPTLDYLICKCLKCPIKVRADAAKALLSKYYEQISYIYDNDLEIIQNELNNLKDKIIESLKQTSNDLSLGEDFNFNELLESKYDEILYLVQIKIGANYYNKIGYTNRNKLTLRMNEIKSSYKINAKRTFNISIKPLFVYSLDNARELEQKFINRMIEQGVKFDTKLSFSGSSECLTGKYSNLSKETFIKIIDEQDKANYQKMF